MMSHIDSSVSRSRESDWQNIYLDHLYSDGLCLPIPSLIVDRDGKKMHTPSNAWTFNLGPSTNTTWWDIKSPLLLYSIQSFAHNRTVRISSSAGSHVAGKIPRLLKKCTSYAYLENAPSLEVFRASLVQVMQELASFLKQNQTYWEYWLPVAWYKWGATRTADLGFDSRFSQRLESIRIPGGPKGVAVRSEDPVRGPLDPELERPLLQLALVNDKSPVRKHLLQKLAVSLCLAFGRNPLCYRLLLEKDFNPEISIQNDCEKTLLIPQIKKRRLIRSSMTSVPLDPFLAELIEEVILSNQQISSTVANIASDIGNKTIELHRPIFMRKRPRGAVLKSADYKYALSFASHDFAGLLKAFVMRHNIISPITNSLLIVTPRRLRYTFATDLVDMGLSKRELAFALNHSDTQNVRVYYGIGERIVPHIEQAARGRIEPILKFFKPSLEDYGDGTFHPATSCSLPISPPVSCYLCPAFRPYAEAKHDVHLRVLEKHLGHCPTEN